MLKLTASVNHRGLAPQLSIQTRFDELDISAISIVRDHIRESVVPVAGIVRAWPRDVSEPACWVWEPVPAWRPLGCSGVTKILGIETVIQRQAKVTYGLVERMYFPSLLISITGA